MGFIMDGLDAESYDRSYSDWALVKRIILYFKPHFWKMTAVAGVVFLSSLMDLLLPVVVSSALDQLQFTPETFDPVATTLLLAAAASMGWVANLIRQWLSAEAVGDVTLDMREDAFNAVTERDMSFYDQFATGKIVSRVLSDTQAFSETVRLTINLMSRLLLVVLLIIYLFTVNLNMTLVLIAIMPFIMYTATQVSHGRAPHRHQLAASTRHRKRPYSGIDQRHRRRQSIPPRADDLRRVQDGQSAILRSREGQRISSLAASSRSWLRLPASAWQLWSISASGWRNRMC